MHLGAVGGLNSFALDPLCGRTDLTLRLQRNALRLEAAMVDAGVDVEFGQPFVGKRGPAFPPALHHPGAVPVPDLQSKAVFVHRAHG